MHNIFLQIDVTMEETTEETGTEGTPEGEMMDENETTEMTVETREKPRKKKKRKTGQDVENGLQKQMDNLTRILVPRRIPGYHLLAPVSSKLLFAYPIQY